MKNENYINIQGWMINELGLKGNELILYAIIYEFSQGDQTGFRGAISYIMGSLKLSNKGVINLLDSLVKKELISKEIKTTGNIYKTTRSYPSCEEKPKDNNTSINKKKNG